MTFYQVFTSHRPSIAQRSRVPTFRGLPEKPRESVFRVDLPTILTPEPILVIGDPTSDNRSPVEDPGAARTTNTSRLSAWVGRRFSRRQLSWDERQLWNRGDVEEGTLAISPPPTRGGDWLEILGPRVEELKAPMNVPSHIAPEGSAQKLTGVQQTGIDKKESKEVNPVASLKLALLIGSLFCRTMLLFPAAVNHQDFPHRARRALETPNRPCTV